MNPEGERRTLQPLGLDAIDHFFCTKPLVVDIEPEVAVTGRSNARALSLWQGCREIVKIGLAGLLFLLVSAGQLVASGEKVTEQQLRQVHAAYLEAKANGFSEKALVKLYSLPGVPVASAVKKLVDLKQSRPNLSIPDADSIAMEATRQRMNMRVLQELAVITGGSVEVMDAGKQNGIRSDKDLMIFDAGQGKRAVSATEMKRLYEEHFERIWDIKLEKLDMSIFDGDASFPDWRDTSISLSNFVDKYKKGQAKLEQNPEAVREAGTWRVGALLRYATNSIVTMVKYHRNPDDPRVRPTIDKNQMRPVPWENNETYYFEMIENVNVKEASVRYRNWIRDAPYRSAMDASYEWWQRHNHTNDFVDRMKYFNRTVGDGVNALATKGWDVQYIFHLDKLGKRDPNLVHAFIQRLVDDVYSKDAGPEKRQHFIEVIELAARIELDKMNKRSQDEADYLDPYVQSISKEKEFRDWAEAKFTKEDLAVTPWVKEKVQAEALSRARQRFFEHQAEIMRYNLVLTARQKLRWDIADIRRAAELRAIYSTEGHDGIEEVKKLRWESWRQIDRIIEKLEDPALIRQIVSEAPDNVRKRLEELVELKRLRVEWMNEERDRAIKTLRKPDPAKVGKVEPELVKLIDRPISEATFRMHQIDEILTRQDTDLNKLKAIMETGEFSDEVVAGKMRARVLESLGFEEREVLKGMQFEIETKFSGNRLFHNAVNMGTLNSLLNVIKVYQETGDLTSVGQTAAWEALSHMPIDFNLRAIAGTSKAVVQPIPVAGLIAPLYQAVHDANYQPLYWFLVAIEIPAAGQIKMAFDITKTTFSIVYNHGMAPLKADRLSQVYMGFILPQPASWSPLKPGWKERTDAAADSIYRFVPGETFEEKRSNLFKFFHDRLDAKLRASGMESTGPEYWEHYERAAEPYVRKYVEDYFNNKGDWTENTIAGIKSVALQPELTAGLANLVMHDFQQSRRNYELIKLLPTFDDLMANQDRVIKANIGVEKKLSAAERLVIERLQTAIADALPKSEVPQTAVPPFGKLEASPPVVQEGQEASILVQLIAPAADKRNPDQPYKIEVKRVDRQSVAAKGALTAEALARELAEDAIFVQPMLDAQKGNEKQRYVLAPLEYEVTVKRPSGDLFSSGNVIVRLVGLDSEDQPVPFGLQANPPPGVSPPPTSPLQGGRRVDLGSPGTEQPGMPSASPRREDRVATLPPPASAPAATRSGSPRREDCVAALPRPAPTLDQESRWKVTFVGTWRFSGGDDLWEISEDASGYKVTVPDRDASVTSHGAVAVITFTHRGTGMAGTITWEPSTSQKAILRYTRIPGKSDPVFFRPIETSAERVSSPASAARRPSPTPPCESPPQPTPSVPEAFSGQRSEPQPIFSGPLPPITGGRVLESPRRYGN
jgi:hypothetical protein